MKPSVAVIGLSLLLAACAKNPEAIAPMSMPVNAYSGLSCEALATELHRSSTALATVEAQQRQAVTGDAMGVFLVGVPLSSLSGADREGAVAQHKGEIIAIEHMQRTKGC
jgi:hypothetical protein